MGTNEIVSCQDCGIYYTSFGLDTVMPRSQWLQIMPDEGGILCANCMVKRASKLDGAITSHLIIDIGTNPDCLKEEILKQAMESNKFFTLSDICGNFTEFKKVQLIAMDTYANQRTEKMREELEACRIESMNVIANLQLELATAKAEVESYKEWRKIDDSLSNELTQLLSEERRSKWISVDERLPEGIKEDVLILYNDGRHFKYMRVAYLDDGRWYKDPWNQLIYVTHWQPLPAPPESEQTSK